jgi:excisionase family DNA binding protein
MARPTTVQQNSRLELLTTAQAAEVLNVHPNTVRNWADSALLPSFRIGPRRDRRFRRKDVESLLQESENGHEPS